MKFKLVAGSEIDALTEDELRQVLHEFTERFETEHADRARPSLQVATDANGVAQIDVYTVPLGMDFRLNFVHVSLDGYSYASMYKSAAGRLSILRNGQELDGFNLAAGIPNTWAEGASSAPHFRNGETVTIRITGGPASTNLGVLIEGDLFPRRP